MLSECRDEAAAIAFFACVIGNNGFPDRVVIGKSGASLAGLQNMNCVLFFERLVLVDRHPAGEISEQHH
jgi:transposase-like protein